MKGCVGYLVAVSDGAKMSKGTGYCNKIFYLSGILRSTKPAVNL